MKEIEIKDGLREVLNSLLSGSFLDRGLVGKLSVLVIEARETGMKSATVLCYLEKVRGVVITRMIFICCTDRNRGKLLVLDRWLEEQIKGIGCKPVPATSRNRYE